MDKAEVPPRDGKVYATVGASLLQATGFSTDGDWVETKDQDPNGDIRNYTIG